MLTENDREKLGQFFAVHFNQDSWELHLWAESPDTVGVVNFMAAEYDIRSLRLTLIAIEHLRDSHFSEPDLDALIFGEFGAELDPTLPGFKENFRNNTLQAWVEQIADLLGTAIAGRVARS